MSHPVNYYPPLRVASTVSDDIIERSLFNICRYSDVVGKIEDNGEFKTIHMSTEESLDELEDSLWPVLERLERDGSLLIFKTDANTERHEDGSEKSGWWHVDGFTTCADETYEKHYSYTLSYLDKSVKGIRLGGWDDPNTYDSDPEPVSSVTESSVTESSVTESSVTASGPEPEPPKKRSWFVRLFCRV